MLSPWIILGLRVGTPVEEIRRKYRQLALQWHPDKNLHRLEVANKRFSEIQQAYERIKDGNELVSAAMAWSTSESRPAATSFKYPVPKVYADFPPRQRASERPQRKQKPKTAPKPSNAESQSSPQPKIPPKPKKHRNALKSARFSQDPKPHVAPSASSSSAAQARARQREANGGITASPALVSTPEPDPSPELHFEALYGLCQDTISLAIMAELRANAFIDRYHNFGKSVPSIQMSLIARKISWLREMTETTRKKLNSRKSTCSLDDKLWWETPGLRSAYDSMVLRHAQVSEMSKRLGDINDLLEGDLERTGSDDEWMKELKMVNKIAVDAGKMA